MTVRREKDSPATRPEYHSAYSGAFVWDPGGNNVEAVYTGPANGLRRDVLAAEDREREPQEQRRIDPERDQASDDVPPLDG